MKSVFKGKITKAERVTQPTNEMHLEVKSVGQSDGKAGLQASFNGVLVLRTVVADEMKLGANITITVSDEEDSTEEPKKK